MSNIREIPIKPGVSVERAIHAALEDLAQNVWNSHKVRINNVRINWFESVGVDETTNIVLGCEVESSSFVSNR